MSSKGRQYHKAPPIFKVEAIHGGVHYAQSPRGLVGVLNSLGCTLTPDKWKEVNAHYKRCASLSVVLVIQASDLIENPLLAWFSND